MATDIFARIEHSRTADEVVHQIEILVLEGILRVGDRLPGERELAKQFDVSRPILREALKVLESRGLLNTQHGGGTFVADVIGQVFHQAGDGAHRAASEGDAGLSRIPTRDRGYCRRVRSTPRHRGRQITADPDRHFDESCPRERRFRGRGRYRRRVPQRHRRMRAQHHPAAHAEILLPLAGRGCVLQPRAWSTICRVLAISCWPSMLAIYEAVMAAIRKPARRAAQAHIDFVSRAMTDAERSGDWERVSKLRLQQRAPGSVGFRPVTKTETIGGCRVTSSE
jgi:GntR family transcriptional repressor for pyruvate dehydrogenase complex